jgi:hypothetical protein
MNRAAREEKTRVSYTETRGDMREIIHKSTNAARVIINIGTTPQNSTRQRPPPRSPPALGFPPPTAEVVLPSLCEGTKPIVEEVAVDVLEGCSSIVGAPGLAYIQRSAPSPCSYSPEKENKKKGSEQAREMSGVINGGLERRVFLE